MINDLKHKLYMGFQGLLMRIPLLVSEKGLGKGVKGAKVVADSLSREERRVHHCIVKKMTVVKEPITVESVAEELEIPKKQVLEIVNKLEDLKLFLFRSDGKGIDWAFPFSLNDTGFKMTAATGEQLFAA